MAVCHKHDIHMKRQVFLEYIRLSISGIIVLLVLCKASHGDDCTVLVTNVQEGGIQSLIEKGS